jgi:hypothetical protein
MAESNNPLLYYAYPGPLTEPGEQASMLKGLPAEIPALCKIVQNMLIHVFWAEQYGFQAPPERKQVEVNVRRISTRLAWMASVDDRLLTVPRPVEKKMIGNCRDFTLLMVTLLRHQGIPARARCGFGMYFMPNHGEDHWVAEYWNADQSRWVRVDAQMDELQVKALGLQFDPCDLPKGQFLTGGEAWQLCRSGQADPDTFGIFDMKGLWFVRGDFIRDIAALNRIELLPWDGWGLMEAEDADSEENLALLDHAAEVVANDDLPQIRALYDNPKFRIPSVIQSWNGAESIAVDWTAPETMPSPIS